MNRKLRIIQSLLAIGIADLLSQSAWNPAMVESAPPSYKHKYVTGTGNATLDTGAVQRAINALGSNGGIITTYGSLTLNGSSITWPPLNQMLRFEILGQWTLNSTLTLHTAVHLVGLGGYYPTQFQVHGPVAGILPPSGNTPTIKVPYGSENTFIENIVINNCSGVGIWMQDCSLVTLKNVGVLEEDVSTAIGVQVDGTFWVWIKDCAFNAKATSGPTIRMTALTPGSTGTGLVDIRDTIIAG